MKVTIKDIAREADVSITTVSRVLNNKVDVSEKTRRKILKLIDKLNYNPNSVARGLVMNKTYTIGLVIPDISNPFFSEIARAIEVQLREYGYSVIFCNTDNHKKWEKESIDLLKSKQVDGIIGSFSYQSCDEIYKLEKEEFPLVQLDRLVEGSKVPSVIIDNTYSAYIATEYLIKKGHKKIAHITGDLNTNTGSCRAEGFKKSLKDNGFNLSKGLFVQGDYSQKSGYSAMKKILGKNDSVTAVFAGNDLMALGAYEAIYEADLKIPDNISIVGHDDFSMASLVRPGLTTMHQPVYKIGKMAAKVLINIIAKKKRPENSEIVIKTDLIERDSVKVV